MHLTNHAKLFSCSTKRTKTFFFLRITLRTCQFHSILSALVCLLVKSGSLLMNFIHLLALYSYIACRFVKFVLYIFSLNFIFFATNFIMDRCGTLQYASTKVWPLLSIFKTNCVTKCLNNRNKTCFLKHHVLLTTVYKSKNYQNTMIPCIHKRKKKNVNIIVFCMIG